jgi:hypothetical protein
MVRCKVHHSNDGEVQVFVREEDLALFHHDLCMHRSARMSFK